MRRNLLITAPNYVIMAVTTVFSTLVHGAAFLVFGGGVFLAISRLSADGKLSENDYIAIIVSFVFCMFHCLALVFLLEKKSPARRTYGFSVVTLVLEILIIPVYCLTGLGTYNMPYGFVLLAFAALLFVSLVGNIYCVIRHTLTK